MQKRKNKFIDFCTLKIHQNRRHIFFYHQLHTKNCERNNNFKWKTMVRSGHMKIYEWKKGKNMYIVYMEKRKEKSFSSHFRLSEGKSFVLSDFLIGI